MAAKAKTPQEKVLARLRQVAPKGDNKQTLEVVNSSEEIPSRVEYVLKTGIKSYDDLVGGMPFGRTVEIYGLPACGKSAMAIRCAVRAWMGHIYRRTMVGGKWKLEQLPQKWVKNAKEENGGHWERDYDITILYIDNEQSLDDSQTITVDGVKIDVVLARCNTVELIFKAVDETLSVLKTVEKETKREQFVLIVVDTIAGTSSKEELAALWGSDDYPRQPKQLRTGFRKMTQEIQRRKVCFVCTNQCSTKFQSGKKGPIPPPLHERYEPFGGGAVGYYATHRLFMHAMETKYTLIKGAKFASGLLVSFYSKKNRLKKPAREGRMVVYFGDSNGDGGGLHDDYSTLETLLYLKFATRDDKGKIAFRFNHFDVPMTTVDPKKAAVVKGRGSKATNPSIGSRSEWPAFYKAHKKDFDALWDKAIDFAFQEDADFSDDDDEEFDETASVGAPDDEEYEFED